MHTSTCHTNTAAKAIDALVEEAKRRFPDDDLFETLRMGVQAIEVASDPSVDPERREVCRRYGLSVAGWVMGLIDSATARRGSAAAPRAAV